MQAKVLSWLVFLGTSAFCLVLWRYVGGMQRLACDHLEGLSLPAFTGFIVSIRWLLLCLPLPWLAGAVITSLQREPHPMPTVAGALLAVAGSAWLAFWVITAMALPFLNIIVGLEG